MADPVRYDADDERGPGTPEQAGEKVAAEQVGAEPEAFPRRQRCSFQRQAVEELLVGRVGCEPGSGKGREPGQEDDGDAGQRQRIAPEAARPVLPARW